MRTTGLWRRAERCIEVETVEYGWLPAPMTADAPLEMIESYVRSHTEPQESEA